MRKILAIHHQEKKLAGLVRTLRELFPGSTALTAQSGEEGLEVARRQQPDVIVLYDGLPQKQKDGNTVCKKLKSWEFTKHIPIIMLPLTDEDETGGDYGNEGETNADIFLSGPLHPRELQAHINLLLRLKEAEDKLRQQQNLFEEAIQRRTESLEKELAELRESEAEWRKMVHASNDGIYLLHNRKFEIINKKFAEMFAVTLEDVNHPDFDFLELVAPKSRPLIEERQRKLERGEKVDSKYEFTALSRDGRELEVEVSVSPVKYKNGMAIQGVVRDVSERKYLEQQLRHSQKIEAISRLAGGIAHDFNNILAIIRGYTELSLDDVQENSTLNRNLQHVLEASDRAKDLVNQILTFSQQNEDDRQSIRMSQIVEESLRVITPSLPTSIKIHRQIEDEEGIVLADPTQIRQVMTNLYANATYAMQESGGVLEVRLEKTVLGAKDMDGFKDIAPGIYLKLTVKDTGHGMAPDVVERIFDPYFTTKAAGEGSGMGLSVIHGIVKKHGGDILVESEPGKGTAFYLYLPRAEEEPRKDTGAPELIPGGKERILFVDDEQVLVYMQQEVLERLGYDVVAVSNSSEALEIFKNDPEIFDMVITDQSMPGLTGIQLSTDILKIRPDIPIILCTGFSETVTREIALKTGVKEFILKPLIKREIAAVIRKVLENQKEESKSEKEE